MTTIPDLIDEMRAGDGNGCKLANAVMRRAADALEDQQKTLDAETAAHDDTLRERDRFRSAIQEALDELGDPSGTGPWLSGNIPHNVRRILTAALEGRASDGSL